MNNKKPLACVVLAAGRGTRMKTDIPKVAHKIAGRSMLSWVLACVDNLNPDKKIVVLGNDMDEIKPLADGCEIALQNVQDGTAGALHAAMPNLKDFDGQVLVVMGDVPLIKSDTLKDLLSAQSNGGVAVLGVHTKNPFGYGRLILNKNNELEGIVEEKDANDAQRKICHVNAGAWAVDGKKLGGWIAQIGDDNTAGERYLTDLPSIASADGAAVTAHICDDTNSLGGVNTRVHLAEMEEIAQNDLRMAAMLAGATLSDPKSVYFSFDTKVGRDVVIGQNVVFGQGVTIEDDVEIKPFSHIEGAVIEKGAAIGPFARIRPNTKIGKTARIGNFVEIKASDIGDGSKIGHLAYVGDTKMGDCVNFSAGAIVANYDGKRKYKTIIGNDAMVGTNTTLVAPVEVGGGAFIAAGSTITKDVPSGALAVARSKSVVRRGWKKR